MYVRQRWKRLLLVAAASLDLCLFAASGLADDAPDDGRRFFDIGVQAYSHGQYASAVAAFREAYRLTQRPGLLFSLAQAYRRAYETSKRPEDLKAAIRQYTSFLATQPSGERKQQAQHYLLQLKERAGGLSLDEPEPAEARRTELVIAATVPEAQLRLDGELVEGLPHAAALTPGHHVLEITARGYLPFKKEIELAEGEVVALNAELVRAGGRLSITGNEGASAFVDGRRVGALPLEPLTLPPGLHTVEVRQPGHFSPRQQIDLTLSETQRLHLVGGQTPQRTVAWVLFGAGASGLVAGGVLGYVALRNDQEAQRLERDEPSNYREFNDTVSARNHYRLAAGISAGVGAAAALAGVFAYFTAPPGPVQSALAKPGWVPNLTLTQQCLQLDVLGRF